MVSLIFVNQWKKSRYVNVGEWGRGGGYIFIIISQRPQEMMASEILSDKQLGVKEKQHDCES